MAETLINWVRLDPKTVRDLADRCLERANYARWPDDIADELALEFFLGAVVGCVMGGSTMLANRVAQVAAEHVAKHGMAGVRGLAQMTNEEAAA
jgi:hypothetical protein